MKNQNLKNTDKEKSNDFGMSLSVETQIFLNRRIEDLKERCPSSSNIELKFAKKKSTIKGTLKVNSFSKKFVSHKISKDPIQTFLLMQEDIEEQLLDWKRNRFSDSLFERFSSNTNTMKKLVS